MQNFSTVVSQLLYVFLSLCYIFPFSFSIVSLCWYDHFYRHGKYRPFYNWHNLVSEWTHGNWCRLWQRSLWTMVTTCFIQNHSNFNSHLFNSDSRSAFCSFALFFSSFSYFLFHCFICDFLCIGSIQKDMPKMLNSDAIACTNHHNLHRCLLMTRSLSV